jgi:hypothetical protein
MRRRGDERGSVLVTVMLVSVVLAVIGGSLMRGTFADLDQGQRSQATNRSIQAAEAGINDYIAKLTEDHLYYAHWVHRAEATRVATGTGVRYDPGAAAALRFDGTLAWTYPDGRDGWLDLGDGLEYDLQVFPPTATRTTVRIVATGRRTGDPSSAKTLEALVRTASVADYQMIANADVAYGATAVANGKIYAGNGRNILHAGTVNANLYAEGHLYRTGTATTDANGVVPGAAGWVPTYTSYSGVPTFSNGSRGYDASNIRTVIKAPIDFSKFTGSIGDVERAAASGGLVLDDPTVAAWWLQFGPGGTIAYKRCSVVDLSMTAPHNVLPTCGTSTIVDVPTNGAVYSGQDVIVAGTVKGQVTVASAHDIVVGGNIDYASTGVDVTRTTNTDVLGLMAEKELLVPMWAPTNLTWRAATLAVEQLWRSVSTTGTLGTMTFYGSTAANQGGYMNQYATRFYNYDPTLAYLQPPYFPVLEDAYTILLQREIP